MATIVQRKRKDGSIAWQVQIRISGHPSNSKSFETKAAAQQFIDRVENNVRIIAGKTPNSPQTIFQQERFLDAANDFLQASHATPSQKSRIRAVLPHMGDVRMGQITSSYIRRLVDKLSIQPSRNGQPYKISSIVQYLSGISIVYCSRTLDFDLTPPSNLFFNHPLLKNWDIGRDRRLTKTEYVALMNHLPLPRKFNAEHWRLLIDLALETAARLQELVLSEFSEFDMQNFIWKIPASHTKGKTERCIPLSSYACSILQRLKAIKSNDSERVFHCWRNSVVVSSSFSAITRKAGIIDLHFHDLRHEAISRMVLYRRGVSVYEIMKIVGHKSIKMLDRYANLRADEMVSRFRTGVIPEMTGGLTGLTSPDHPPS
ncbi:site-specific integrase [Herbaspirillum seropedicae]|uniref:site-specific integrase n=1 Tax=Herbaspirillum seropedicae TaxID=964 RepID=UPI0015DE66E1|nr:site-specific integrase [Herbaspirillum seropedicae]